MDQEMKRPVSDKILRALAEEIEKDEAKTAILNPMRFRDMQKALSLLRCVRQNGSVSITYQLHAPMKSMGCITIQGKTIDIDDPVAFAEAIRLSSNVDFYPLADGGVCIDFTFHGLTKHIG